MRFAFLTLVALGAALPTFAALQWEQTTLQLEAGPLDEKIEGVFRFSNNGDRPITITNTHASCGCTVPTLEKKTFAPGEAGEMRVVYSIAEGANGRQEKTITVATDAVPEETYLLTLSVQVPGLWEVHPRFVRWEHDEEPAAKTITIRALHPEVARPVSVEPRDTRFTAELKSTPDDPAVFVVVIKPTSTAEPMMVPVVVATNVPSEKKQHTVQLYAVVR
jgi:hypothetical protein